MLDALIPACEVALANPQGSGHEIAKAMAEAATKGAEETANMKTAQAGRSAYVGSSDLIGNVDPGSMAAAYTF